MFGKKKDNGIPIMHYEGIEDFATDYPVRIKLKESELEIKFSE